MNLPIRVQVTFCKPAAKGFGLSLGSKEGFLGCKACFEARNVREVLAPKPEKDVDTMRQDRGIIGVRRASMQKLGREARSVQCTEKKSNVNRPKEAARALLTAAQDRLAFNLQGRALNSHEGCNP